MLTFSVIPLIFVGQLLFLIWAGWRANTAPAPLICVVVIFTLWGITSVILALTGFYDTGFFLSTLPGLWLPVVPLVIGIGFSVLKPVRRAFADIVRTVPVASFVALQAIRITAFGTLIKTLQGSFPVSVELAIGLTDFVFGLSAFYIFYLVKKSRLSANTIVLWHCVGILIILVPGGLAIQTALPGLLEVFSESPTAQVMLDYPMVLAPSLVVPIFFLFNALGAAAAITQLHPKTELCNLNTGHKL